MPGRIKHKVEGVYPDTPVVVAARRILRSRLAELEHYLREARGSDGDIDTETVHQLRVATRRAAAALRAFRPFCELQSRRKLQRGLRRIRRAASAARRDDVHLDRMRADRCDAPAEFSAAYDLVESSFLASRRDALEELRRAVSRKRVGRLRKLRQRTLQLISHEAGETKARLNGSTALSDIPIYNLRELAAMELPAVAAGVQEAAALELDQAADMHQLRIAGKKLRYAIEIFAEAQEDADAEATYAFLEDLQERLGELNDLAEIAARIGELADDAGEAPVPSAASLAQDTLRALHERYAALRDTSHQRALAWLDENKLARAVGRFIDIGPARRARPAGAASKAATNGHDGHDIAAHHHRRIAAIDVGTNSVRLVIAETDAAKGFRIIEDIKETTRLGGGVYTTGRLQSFAIEKTLAALERMRAVAGAKNVEQLRAVGTSAVREAANRAEFLELALRRTGIDIEVLDAEQEARLAFSSVANTFDLDDRCIAVADIGGGSTELVLSTAGVIDAIYPLPLGAVRLTELYGNGKGDYRYEELTQAVARVMGERLHNSRHRPFQIIGTGGTFTSLARVAMIREPTAGGHVRFSFALGGYEFRHAQITRLLEWLRDMPLDERRRLPGMSSTRAEIIVAGVCIVEKLMHCFGVDRLRVHDGGIRDGLLLKMVDDLGIRIEPPRAHGAELIQSVRRFAERCEYDAAHSEHVAFLSLRIFDQLAEQGVDLSGTWSRLDHRALLHAAGILHDAGMLIDVRRHHRHSYDLVLHADLPAMSRRELEIVANICRYHRRQGPTRQDKNFRRLSNDDQRLVAHLAGILRIADGLDRTHARRVRDVHVSVGVEDVRFRALADNRPDEELTYARRKADVFQAAFRVRTRLRWERTAPEPAEVEETGAAI